MKQVSGTNQTLLLRLIGPTNLLHLEELSWHDIDVLDMPAERYSDVRDSVTVADSSYSDWQIAA